VDDDPACLDLVGSALERDEGFDVVTAADRATVLDRLDGVDCVVSDYRMPELDGLELLAAIRERDPRLPFVMVAGDESCEVARTVLAEPWTDYLRRDVFSTCTDLLPTRVGGLVDHHRTAMLAHRALAAVESGRDGVAIVESDGTVAFADRTYASRFGYEAEELIGRSWRRLYPAPEVERIESSALSVAAEGWRWSGNCAGHHADGGTVAVRTTVTAVGDGSLAFGVSGPDSDAN
jgi:PAS domain S-box-containing protein